MLHVDRRHADLLVRCALRQHSSLLVTLSAVVSLPPALTDRPHVRVSQGSVGGQHPTRRAAIRQQRLIEPLSVKIKRRSTVSSLRRPHSTQRRVRVDVSNLNHCVSRVVVVPALDRDTILPRNPCLLVRVHVDDIAANDPKLVRLLNHSVRRAQATPSHLHRGSVLKQDQEALAVELLVGRHAAHKLALAHQRVRSTEEI